MSDFARRIKQRPLGLVLLVIYKAGTAIALLLISVAIRFAWLHYSRLSDYTLPSHRFVIRWILQHIAQLSPHTLMFAAIAAGLYGLLSAIEAIGLWSAQTWARWLVLVGVGASLPIEVLELLHAASWLKFGLLVINSLAFWYVLKQFPQRSSTN